jgi:hypothetical protein
VSNNREDSTAAQKVRTRIRKRTRMRIRRARARIRIRVTITITITIRLRMKVRMTGRIVYLQGAIVSDEDVEQTRLRISP